jgi:hypothetical protein
MKKDSERKYRFFYHYYKQKRKMSIHFRGTCTTVSHIICQPECQTKWRKTQPQLIMQGWATDVIINNDIAVIK